MVGPVSHADHIRPVQERSTRTTDPVALNLFQQLRKMSAADCRFVLSALEGRLAGASGERVAVVRSAIELFCHETGETPFKKRYERWRVACEGARHLPSATFIANTWNGSWSQAMHELGLQPAPDHPARRMAKHGPVRPDEELLEHLRECAAELGRTPTSGDYETWQRAKVADGIGAVRYLSRQTYRNRFGSWPNAVAAAGLSWDGSNAARTRNVDWASGQPLQLLREAGEELGVQRLRCEQYRAWRERRIAQQAADGDTTAVATGESIGRHYGGWRLALSAAGLMSAAAAQNMKGGAGVSFDERDVDRAISRFAKQTSGPPTRGRYVHWREAVMRREPDSHLPSEVTLGQMVGSWPAVRARVEACRAADEKLS